MGWSCSLLAKWMEMEAGERRYGEREPLCRFSEKVSMTNISLVGLSSFLAQVTTKILLR